MGFASGAPALHVMFLLLHAFTTYLKNNIFFIFSSINLLLSSSNLLTTNNFLLSPVFSQLTPVSLLTYIFAVTTYSYYNLQIKTPPN